MTTIPQTTNTTRITLTVCKPFSLMGVTVEPGTNYNPSNGKCTAKGYSIPCGHGVEVTVPWDHFTATETTTVTTVTITTVKIEAASLF